MNEKKVEEPITVVSQEATHWFSTYGLMTAARALGNYQINLEQTELVEAIRTPTSFYHHLLRIPLRNILNGIILQQAHDYHVYVQKLLIDYLLSGESAKSEEAQGSLTRDTLEHERTQLVTVADQFHKLQSQHDFLIASSQAALIKIVKAFNLEIERALSSLNTTLKKTDFVDSKRKIHKAIRYALIHCNILSAETKEGKSQFIATMNKILQVSLTQENQEKMALNLAKIFQFEDELDAQLKEFSERAEVVMDSANSFRTRFYETALRVIELIKSLPDYKIDPLQDAINRESLDFDSSIGSSA